MYTCKKQSDVSCLDIQIKPNVVIVCTKFGLVIILFLTMVTVKVLTFLRA